MTKKRSTRVPSGPLAAALARISEVAGSEETEGSILGWQVYEGEKVTVIISTGQKFTVWWDEIEGAGRPEATIKS